MPLTRERRASKLVPERVRCCPNICAARRLQRPLARPVSYVDPLGLCCIVGPASASRADSIGPNEPRRPEDAPRPWLEGVQPSRHDPACNEIQPGADTDRQSTSALPASTRRLGRRLRATQAPWQTPSLPTIATTIRPWRGASSLGILLSGLFDHHLRHRPVRGVELHPVKASRIAGGRVPEPACKPCGSAAIRACGHSTIFQKESLRVILPSTNSSRSTPRTSRFFPETDVPVSVHSETPRLPQAQCRSSP